MHCLDEGPAGEDRQNVNYTHSDAEDAETKICFDIEKGQLWELRRE